MRLRCGTSTGKIIASSSLLQLTGAWGFCWGKQLGVVLRNKAETCKNALKPPNLDLMWKKQTKSVLWPL